MADWQGSNQKRLLPNACLFAVSEIGAECVWYLMSGESISCNIMFIAAMRSMVTSKSKPWNISLLIVSTGRSDEVTGVS